METDSNIHGQLVFKNVAKRRFNRERIVFATGGAGIFLYTYAKKKKKQSCNTYLKAYTKFNSKFDQRPNYKL